MDVDLALDHLPLVADLHLVQSPHQLVVVDEADVEIASIHRRQGVVVVPLTMIIVGEVPQEVALHHRDVDEIALLCVNGVLYEKLFLLSQMRKIINLDL